MSCPKLYPRSIERLLVEAHDDSPVVLIHGPRQCGKTTLAQFTCSPNMLAWHDSDSTGSRNRLASGYSRENRDYSYFSFDDPATRDGARADPTGFVFDLPPELPEPKHVRRDLDELKRFFDAANERRRKLGKARSYEEGLEPVLLSARQIGLS